jgi:hypothetical protein
MAGKVGICCICGCSGPLSFEHVPPRKAYNDQRVFEASIQHLVANRWDGQQRPLQGTWVQGGTGKETLCEQCNNDTGAWYGSAYVSWARQGMRLLHASGGTLKLAYPYTIFPLRIVKQIVVMFFSACGPAFHKRYPDLVRFILDRSARNIPHNLRIYAYMVDLEKSAGFRQSGATGVVNFGRSTEPNMFAEIAFAPFGFILALRGNAPRTDLCDITYLAEEPYHRKETWFLKMPVLPIVTWLPGDFRTKEQVEKDVMSNEVLGQYHLDQIR